MPKVTKDKIIFDAEDWLSGVDYLRVSRDFQKGLSGLSFVESFDPIRNFGYAAPGALPTDATNISSVTGMLLNAVVQNSDAYALSNDGKIHHITNITGSSTTVDTGAPFPKTIAGVSPVGSDCLKYYVGSTEYFFYSYSTTTFWDVGRYDFAATFSDTYMSVTAATPLANPYRAGGKGFPHPMIVGDNNILYMGDRNYVHAFNGQNGASGTFSANVLDLPNGFIISSFANYKQFLAIAAYKNNSSSSFNYLSEAKVFFWDTFSDSFTFAVDLKDNYVTELFTFKDTLACFTQGSPDFLYAQSGASGGLRLKIFDGNLFQTEKAFKAGALPIRGGVQVVNEDIYFNAGGKICSYTNLGDRYIFNELFTTSTSSGLLKIFVGGSTDPVIHFSNGSGSGAGLRMYQTNYNAAGSVYSKVVEPDFQDYARGQITKVKVTYQDTVAVGGRTLSLQIATDANGGTAIFSNKDGVTNRTEEYFYNADGTSLNIFKQLQLYLIWGNFGSGGSSTAPIISKVEISYQPINI